MATTVITIYATAIKLWVGLGWGDSTVQFYWQPYVMLVPCDSLFVYYFLSNLLPVLQYMMSPYSHNVRLKISADDK